METKENRPTTAAPGNGAPRNTMSGTSPQSALRNQLRGADFAQGEAMLAPVQRRESKRNESKGVPRDGGELAPMEIDAEVFPLEGISVEAWLRFFRVELKMMYLRMATNHVAGFSAFIDRLQFDPTQDSEEERPKNAIMLVATKLLDKLLSALPEGPVLGFLKDIGTLLYLPDAPSTGDLGTYMLNESQRITKYYDQMFAIAEVGCIPRLRSDFDKLTGIPPEAHDVALTGEHAIFMKQLELQRSALVSIVPSAAQYQDEATIAWLSNRNEGGKGATRRGLRDLSNGVIRVEIDASEGAKGWAFQFDRALLYSSVRSGQAADLMRDALASGRRTLWTCGLPIYVVFKGPGAAGGTTRYEVQVSAPGKAVSAGGMTRDAARIWADLVNDAALWPSMEAGVAASLSGA